MITQNNILTVMNYHCQSLLLCCSQIILYLNLKMNCFSEYSFKTDFILFLSSNEYLCFFDRHLPTCHFLADYFCV